MQDNKETRPISDKQAYIFFTRNDSIGYLQVNRFTGFDFSSVHKPNRECGTGFSIHNELHNPTIKHAEDCFIPCPPQPVLLMA